MKRVMGGTKSMHGENAKRNKILVGKPELKRPQRRNYNNFYRFFLYLISFSRQTFVKAATNFDLHKSR